MDAKIDAFLDDLGYDFAVSFRRRIAAAEKAVDNALSTVGRKHALRAKRQLQRRLATEIAAIHAVSFCERNFNAACNDAVWNIKSAWSIFELKIDHADGTTSVSYFGNVEAAVRYADADPTAFRVTVRNPRYEYEVWDSRGEREKEALNLIRGRAAFCFGLQAKELKHFHSKIGEVALAYVGEKISYDAFEAAVMEVSTEVRQIVGGRIAERCRIRSDEEGRAWARGADYMTEQRMQDRIRMIYGD